MTTVDITIICTQVATVVGGFFASFWIYQNRKLTIEQEERRIKREEAKEEREAERRKEEKIDAIKEKRAQEEAAFKLAQLTKTTAEGIQKHISAKTNETIGLVKESKEERKLQVEEIKQINKEQIQVSNKVNDKMVGLGILLKSTTGIDADHITKVEVTNFPTEQE